MSERPVTADSSKGKGKANDAPAGRWGPAQWRWWTVERATLAVELLGIVAILLGLYFTHRSVQGAAEAVQLSQEQVVAAYDQLHESRYQAVFEQQLALWQLAIEHPEVGAHFMAGTPLDATPSAEELSDTKRHAAVASALDFYVYAWNLAPRDQDGSVPGGLDPESAKPPEGVTEPRWRGWATWASTIAEGFRQAPDLCRALKGQAASYGEDFVTAVREATSDCATD